MQSFEQAAAYVEALTGQSVDTAEMWFRCIHDTNKGIAAHKYFGTLASVWNTLVQYNNDGWGIFANINAFAHDVEDHNLDKVQFIRTHIVDLDNVLTSQQNYQLTAQSSPVPAFGVQTSPGKFHVYWTVNPYTGNEFYNDIQRKLRQVFDGDKSVIDPTRVLRVPGFYHLKNPAAPFMVNCWGMGGARGDVEALRAALVHVNVIDAAGGRKALGTVDLQAPSLDWLKYALSQVNPNELARHEWLSISAAMKQAGWNHADETTLRTMWEEWCAQYGGNDPDENDKLWNSVRDSETGWKSFYHHVPTLRAYEKLKFKSRVPLPHDLQPQQPMPQPSPQQPVPGDHVPREPLPQRPDASEFGDILSDRDCQVWFKNCFFVENMGKILTPSGRFLDSTKFNGSFGGKLFTVTIDGKTTNEPWAAATRSTLWTVPKVDHTRFLPDYNTFDIIEDDMGRKGVNTYIPIRYTATPGDVSPFLRHMELMLPNENDRNIFFTWLAGTVKFPGHKIPWSPLIQSTEGVGKGIIREMMQRILGLMYCYSPKAPELVKSGSTFNAWMRGKLLIIVDEIKIDEKRELIEILKPMITDNPIEIQGKGENQELEDNPANWMFFSNYKDAIPLSQNGRRYAIFYSAIQSYRDLIARGMDDAYFNALAEWMQSGGSKHVAHWLLNYPITEKDIPMRAPETSSAAEARRISRGPIEIAIENAIDDGIAGFRGGYVSLQAAMRRLRDIGARTPAVATVARCLEAMGYVEIGRAPRAYGAETMTDKATVYANNPALPVSLYGAVQGYE